MLLLKSLFLLLFFISFQNLCSSKSNKADVCSIWSDDWKNSVQIRELIRVAVKPVGGPNAGKYSEIKVKSWEECVSQCCQFDRCNVAYYISSTCLHIECISDDLCQPVEGDNTDINDETLYLKVRSVQSTAAAIDFDDPGLDQCNQTTPCSINEQCQEVSINAETKRRICLCNRDSGYRRINGVCRQYFSRTKPCALYERDYENNNDDEENSRASCRKNEECLPPSDRAKHGYCQCKLGYIRKNENGKCVLNKQETSTVTTKSSLNFKYEVHAGEDQLISLPQNQIDLYARVVLKLNQSEIDQLNLKKQNFSLSWSLKSSTNKEQIDIFNQDDLSTHVLVKKLQQGNYEFEVILRDEQGITLASDSVKVEVGSGKTTTAPLTVKVTSPVNVHLPKQTILLEAQVFPSDRSVTYHWTYTKNGPVTPILQNADTSILFVSNLRSGTYTFRLLVTDNLGNEQTKTVDLIATGDPIEARVANSREIVFWPSNDVVLDGTSSIIEDKTMIEWTLISTDNKQRFNDIEISSLHSLKTRISNLRIGQYRFQLTLTTDDQLYTSKKDVLVIVYSQNGQPPKIQIHFDTQSVNVLNNLLILNASTTTADYGISKWLWNKSPLSPAMGYFINNSHLTSIAYLTNLIEGQYVFTLQVTDDRQQMSEANITVNIDGIVDAENLIEIKFFSAYYLNQRTLENLLAQIRVFLIDLYPNINILMSGMPKENLLLIKGIDSKTNLILPPKSLVNHLQTKIKSLRSASNMNILSIETYLCLSNCSHHGKCDHQTKRCICERYHMENWFKSLVLKEPNCDFLIHYFVLLTIGVSIVSLIFCWICLCCCLRCRRRRKLLERRKRIRYQLLHNDDDDNNNNDDDDQHHHHQKTLSSRKKNSKTKSRFNKSKESTSVMSESDCNSDEQTLYDRPLLTAKMQANSPTVKHRGLKVPVQDSNGSPMLRNNGQSPTTTDNSVA